MAEIRIEHVTKSFGDKVAVDDANLVIRDKEFLVLLGPSGCGKTTLLRAIAGLGMADSGRIAIGDRDVTYLQPGKRKISMVFQSYAIFPHMSVRDNIGFGLKMDKVPKQEMAKRVEDAAAMLHIEDLLDRKPSDMSGGQRQRVAVARALAMHAQVLLMDEPLSNLDALLRLEMRAELKKLLADLNATTVYVTHDQIEALSMGDRIAVMRDGVVQQVDVPSVVYERPANKFVGGFIGNPPMNFIPGTHDGADVTIADVTLTPPAEIGKQIAALDGNDVEVGIRAENIVVHTSAHDDAIPVQVEVVEPLGSQNLLTVRLGDHTFKVSTHPTFEVPTDDQVWLQLPVEHLRWIDPSTEEMLYG